MAAVLYTHDFGCKYNIDVIGDESGRAEIFQRILYAAASLHDFFSISSACHESSHKQQMAAHHRLKSTLRIDDSVYAVVDAARYCLLGSFCWALRTL